DSNFATASLPTMPPEYRVVCVLPPQIGILTPQRRREEKCLIAASVCAQLTEIWTTNGKHSNGSELAVLTSLRWSSKTLPSAAGTPRSNSPDNGGCCVTWEVPTAPFSMASASGAPTDLSASWTSCSSATSS